VKVGHGVDEGGVSPSTWKEPELRSRQLARVS
jgi:hypothetical protein